MTETKEGIVVIISKTGGVKFFQEDVWYNPVNDLARKLSKPELKNHNVKLTLVSKDSKEFTSIISLGIPTKSSDKVVKIKGKDFVTYKGLLDKAHEKGLQNIEILDNWVSENMKQAWCKVRAHFKNGQVKTSFDGIGSSTPENTGSMTISHPIEMAHTRAKARALRDALNIGEVAIEELKKES